MVRRDFSLPLPHVHVILLPMVLFFVFGCGNDTREVVSERYPNGGKKTVLIYEGEGTDEQLIERRTYARNGELVQIYNPSKDDTLYYEDLNKEILSGEGFRKFLSEGAWKKKSEGGVYMRQFAKDSIYIMIGDSPIDDTEDTWFGAYPTKYLDSTRTLEGSKDDEDGGHTVDFHVDGPDIIRKTESSGYTVFERIDINIKEKVQQD